MICSLPELRFGIEKAGDECLQVAVRRMSSVCLILFPVSISSCKPSAEHEVWLLFVLPFTLPSFPKCLL